MEAQFKVGDRVETKDRAFIGEITGITIMYTIKDERDGYIAQREESLVQKAGAEEKGDADGEHI